MSRTEIYQGYDDDIRFPELTEADVGSRMLVALIADKQRRRLAELSSRQMVSLSEGPTTYKFHNQITVWFIAAFSKDIENGFIEFIKKTNLQPGEQKDKISLVNEFLLSARLLSDGFEEGSLSLPKDKDLIIKADNKIINPLLHILFELKEYSSELD
ncbi:MAG: hypothetical protein ABI721_00210 [Candidatus Dojkabacteria bacterium]